MRMLSSRREAHLLISSLDLLQYALCALHSALCTRAAKGDASMLQSILREMAQPVSSFHVVAQPTVAMDDESLVSEQLIQSSW